MFMPRLFEYNGNIFFFFSNEGSPLEPCHVHIRKAEKRMKIFLDPSIRIAYIYGYNTKEVKSLLNFIIINENEIRRKWHEYFNQ